MTERKLTENPNPESGEPIIVGRSNRASAFAEEYHKKRSDRQTRRIEKDATRFAAKRQDARKNCFTVAALLLPEKGITIDGVIREASRRGLTFRPASNYIEERDGEAVQIAFSSWSRNGIIRSSRPDGHGIQLFDPLADEDIAAVIEASLNLDAYQD